MADINNPRPIPAWEYFQAVNEGDPCDYENTVIGMQVHKHPTVELGFIAQESASGYYRSENPSGDVLQIKHVDTNSYGAHHWQVCGSIPVGISGVWVHIDEVLLSREVTCLLASWMIELHNPYVEGCDEDPPGPVTESLHAAASAAAKLTFNGDEDAGKDLLLRAQAARPRPEYKFDSFVNLQKVYEAELERLEQVAASYD